MESTSVVAFKRWILDHGGSFHPNAVFSQALSGCGLIAQKDIPGNEVVVSCPFDLAITGTTSQAAVSQLLAMKEAPELACRQWICIYMALHWIVGKGVDASQHLKHFPYIDLLPPQSDLLTALHFTADELESFKGTNIYGACNDRVRVWQTEWMQCREVVCQHKPDWGTQFEWTLYLAAATYISSRAFPSTVLSQTPRLPNLDDDNDTPSDPVLLPGVDILNHARGQPVTWISHTKPWAPVERVAIVPHQSTPAGREIFNNYGPKPNAELLLGYGFTLPKNPDDTIILKLGGIGGRKWSVGRNARGVEGLWAEILIAVGGNDESEKEGDFETILDASGALGEMVSAMYENLPTLDAVVGKVCIRPQVVDMHEHYLEGQRAILESLIKYAQEKEGQAVELARRQGVKLVLEN